MIAELKSNACPVKGCFGDLCMIEDHYECGQCGFQAWPPEREVLPRGNEKFYRELMQPEGLIIKGSSRSSGRKRKKPPKKSERFLEV